MSRVGWLFFAGFVIYLGGIGGFLTASALFSPRREAVGKVQQLSSSRALLHTSHHLSLTLGDQQTARFDTAEEIHAAVKAGDTVRVEYRKWDDTATRVEVLEGEQRGWAWKKGISDSVFFGELFWGPVLLLVAGGMLWNIGHAFRRPRAPAPAKTEPQEPPVPQAPLTDEEKEQAARTGVYIVWYEDRFGFGEDRHSFPVEICLSREEADQEVSRIGRPLHIDGVKGYEVTGPDNLLSVQRLCRLAPKLVREVLRRVANGERGPVPIPF